jgi:hypothetical protein
MDVEDANGMARVGTGAWVAFLDVQDANDAVRLRLTASYGFA